MWWPAVVKAERELPLRLDYGRSPHAYVNQRLQTQLELLMMSGVPLETCWAFNKRWNNKFCLKVASCWLFLLNPNTMHGSINIKIIIIQLTWWWPTCWPVLMSHVWKLIHCLPCFLLLVALYFLVFSVMYNRALYCKHSLRFCGITILMVNNASSHHHRNGTLHM